ncbi:MAG: transketolase [Clostridia bacterium]|nr:transketolase [Clostridia bacterium]
MKEFNPEYLKKVANDIRKGAVTAVYKAKSGHPGGSLSISDVLAYLYFCEMNVNPNNPKDPDRDRFVLSKGHTAPALYATLALKGYFGTDELLKLRQLNAMLQGHPDMKHIPGVDMTTGSLGQGISAACGMALSAKISNKNYNVYAVLGDGEIQEGQVWEAFMFANHYKLSNLCAFIDNNNLQIDGPVDEVMSPYPIDEKLKAFGFNVIVIDAHSLEEIKNAVEAFKAEKDRPTAIIMKSVKGKGVSFMENNVSWHGAAPNEEQYNIAMADLEKIAKELEA